MNASQINNSAPVPLCALEGIISTLRREQNSRCLEDDMLKLIFFLWK